MIVELRERENMRLNIIVHGIPGQANNISLNRERMEEDKEDIDMVFREMGARAADLRFCRRIGEKGEQDRPIVFGVQDEAQKRHILLRAKELRNTKFDCVTFVPDLTKSQ